MDFNSRILNLLSEIPDPEIPVISIGNLSFGGTGKTPCIIYLGGELAKEYKVEEEKLTVAAEE